MASTIRLESLFALLFLLLHSIVLAYPSPAQNGTLSRRSCERANPFAEWKCDDKLPTLAQFVQAYSNVADGGRVTAENRVMFWTNLQTNKIQVMEWCGAWIKNQDWGNAFQWVAIFNAIWEKIEGREWYNQQQVWAMEVIAEKGKTGAATYFDLYNRWTYAYLDGGAHDNQLDAWTYVQWCSYQALAMAARHPDVYLFTAGDSEWSNNKIWAQTEYPALTRNPNVKNIWRVDPRTDACAPKILLWTSDPGNPDRIESTELGPKPQTWSCEDYMDA